MGRVEDLMMGGGGREGTEGREGESQKKNGKVVLKKDLLLDHFF